MGLIVTSVLAALGCGGIGPPDLETYFVSDDAAVPACPSDGRLAGRRQVRLFVAGDDERLPAATRGLARYFGRHGLEFFTRAAPERISLEFVIDNRASAVREAVAAEFPGVNIDDPALPSNSALWSQVRRFALNFQLHPVRDFIAAHAAAGEAHVTSVVLVPRLEGAPPTATLPAIGMSLSPPLLAALGKQAAFEPPPLLEVDLPRSFTPLVFLSAAALSRMATEDPSGHDRAVAHELGHSAGLLHAAEAQDLDNLMYPSIRRGVDECAQHLTDHQLAVLQAGLGLDPAAVAAPEVPAARRQEVSSSGPAGARGPAEVTSPMPAPLERLLWPLARPH